MANPNKNVGPFNLIKIRDTWNLAGFRDLKTSKFGERHNCLIILNNQETSTYSGSIYKNGKIAIDPVLCYNSQVSETVITRCLLYFREEGWTSMKKKDLEVVFCGRTPNKCALI